jgi:hypothetical protein
VPIVAVDDDARKRGEQQGRDLTAETDNTEQKRGAGEPVNQPARGDPRDPGPDERYTLASEEESVIAMSERAENSGALLVGHDSKVEGQGTGAATATA